MYCTRCGHRNPDDARFCANCGHQLQDDATLTFTPVEVEGEETGEEVFQPAEELEKGQALLVVKRGANAGSTFLIDKDLTTAGRHPESDIFLDDVTVSRRHAEFNRSGESFLVRDVGSLNGTYLNRERIDSSELANGDEVQIGKFRLVYLTSSAEGAR